MHKSEYTRYADLTYEIGENLKSFRENLGNVISEKCGLLGEVDDIIDAIEKLTEELGDKEEMA